MLLELASQLEVVEVVETVDGISQCVVVLFLNEQLVVSVVDGFNVKLRKSESYNQEASEVRGLTCCTAMRYDRMSGM